MQIKSALVKSIIPLLLFLSTLGVQGQDAKNNWVDSVFSSLNEEQRIAQLFMVAAYSNKTALHEAEIKSLISRYNIGGLIFFQGGPERQARLTNIYQGLAKTPLMIAMDAEWGLGMRLDSTISYPRQMTLGAIQNDSYIEQMGEEIGRQCKALGMHINFAPVVDVNNNFNNPVINDRSFGENKELVAQKGIAYMRGLEKAGVMANAKHFPGHGDTDRDSHKTLPSILKSKEQLDSLELYPFKKMIEAGLPSLMVAHLNIPAYDSSKNTATTLSKYVVTELLQNELGFKGLIFTDALNMQGVAGYFSPGEVDVKALIAGNDVLLFSQDVPLAIKKIEQAINFKKIPQKEVDEKVKKILAAKYDLGLSKEIKPINVQTIYSELNTPQAELLRKRLYEQAITVAKNQNDLIPISSVKNIRIAAVSIGEEMENQFLRQLQAYADVKTFAIDKDASVQLYNALKTTLSDYDLVIVGMHGLSRYSSNNFKISEQSLAFVRSINIRQNLILSVFNNPYCLKNFEGFDHVIMAYEDNEVTQQLAAELIFGGIKASGKLPVSSSVEYFQGLGLIYNKTNRFEYTSPEDLGINSASLKKIDSIIELAIKDEAMPGCQVLFAKEGKVFFQKTYGHHTYNKKQEVRLEDKYDIASITKVASTMLAIMRLHEQGVIDIDEPIFKYMPQLAGTNKENLTLREMLAHQAGLVSWIPFFKYSLDTIDGRLENYSAMRNSIFPTLVANNMYLKENYNKAMWDTIVNSPIEDRGNYKYSDLAFYFMQYIVGHITFESLDFYVQEQFYDELGLQNLTYKPLNKFNLSEIVPTERDTTFRNQVVQGYVHDPGAAMLGGVGGHAGLFSNANDLAIIMQMLLNKGSYGGQDYFKPETIDLFTQKAFDGENRRGIGFDKPNMAKDKPGPGCDSASEFAFGHSGFTGTYAWADPKYNLVYVFLSNRVYPDAYNWKLVRTNVRSNVMQVVYDQIIAAETADLN
ncbi:MAG: beta-N-acetylhexosaminidase [Sphingobacteriales bacterium]|jgi:beta-N-acetylhexosaminidase